MVSARHRRDRHRHSDPVAMASAGRARKDGVRGEQWTCVKPALTDSLQFLSIALYGSCLTSFATEFVSCSGGPSFLYMLHGFAPGYARLRTIICTQGIGLAKEELLTLEGRIDEILPDGRFSVILDNEHRIIAYTAGKMRRYRIRSVVGDRVHVEMTPYDLTKGRIVYRERTPGQGPGGVRQRVTRR